MKNANLLRGKLFFAMAIFFSLAVAFSSCKKKPAEGCTDVLADNYDENAVVDNGSCIYVIKGCMDDQALNYNPEATENAGCKYPPEQPEVKQKRKVTLIEFTGTWCPPCGDWGGDRFHDAIETLGDDIVPLAAHVNSDIMKTEISTGYSTNLSVTSVPSFWVGDVNPGQSVSSMSSKVQEYMSNPIEAAVGLNYLTHNGKFMIEAATKFFENVNGTYYMQVLVLESDIDGGPDAQTGYVQSSGDENYIHEYVIRTGATGSTWGELVGDGSISAGEVVNKYYEVDIQDEWNSSNLSVAVVLWKYDPGASPQYQYVNAWK